MALGILSDIIEKVREVAALGNDLQATQPKIIKYINSYYLYDLPDELRILKLKDVYTFNTIQGVDTYPFNFDSWSSVEAPAYIAKSQVPLFQDPQNFYSYSYGVQQIDTIASGNGTAGTYSGTSQTSPILRSIYNNPMASTQTASTAVFPSGYPPTFAENNISRIQNILITANTATGTLNVTDDGNGGLIGDVANALGTINYQTGAVANLTFSASIPSGTNIVMNYTPVSLAQPSSILFFQNQFVLRPVPDKGYTVEITAYREPSQALLGTTDPDSPNLSGRPEHLDWWEMIAFGVAKKFYQDRLDVEGVQMMDLFLQEKVEEAKTRAYAQLGSRQIDTIFKDESNQLNNSGGFYFGNF